MDENEKQRLMEYFRARINRLEMNKSAVHKTCAKKDVEEARAKIEGRIDENKRLMGRLDNNEFWNTVDWYIGKYGRDKATWNYECDDCGERFKDVGNWLKHDRNTDHQVIDTGS